MIRQCPLCNSKKARESFIILSDSKKKTLLRTCMNCGLCCLADLDKSRASVYDENYSVWGADEKGIARAVEDSKKQNFKKLLLKLKPHLSGRSFKGKSILDIGTGNGYLLEMARELGFRDCYGLELSGSAARIAGKKFPGRIFNCEVGRLRVGRQFDVIVMADLIEHLPRVKHDFAVIASHLKKGGLLLITTPNTDSLTRKIFPKTWYQYKFEHVVYFNKKSMRWLLKGFRIRKMSNNVKSLKLAYYKAYFRKYVSKSLSGLIPEFLGSITITNPFMGELLVIARKS